MLMVFYRAVKCTVPKRKAIFQVIFFSAGSLYKMTVVGFLILFGLNCLLLPCSKGAITSPPPDGTQYVFLPGKTAKIKWEFDDPLSSLQFRSWYFTSGDGSLKEGLATISENESTNIRTRLFEVDIEKPGTLVLKNVNKSYTGMYRFTLVALTQAFTSSVTVSITKKPTVTLNCSSSILDIGDDFICECKGLGGNPPANVTWYKDGNQMQGKRGTTEQLLTVIKVDETDSGTYKCVAESYPNPLYRDEKSIRLYVTIRPKDTYIELNPNPATLDQSFTIACSSRGFPVPSYKISHNGTHLIDDKTYIINNVGWSHAGKYECNADNGFGPTVKNSKFLKVITGGGPVTQKPSIPNNIPNGSGNGCDILGTVISMAYCCDVAV